MFNEGRIRELLGKLPEQPITDAAIDELARAWSIAVPDELRAWLKLSADPRVPASLLGFGARTNIESVLEMYPMWKAKKWIPIGDDRCGNYYVVATKGEFGHGSPVLFIETMESVETPAYLVASSTGRFLEFFFEAELVCHRLSSEFLKEYHKHGHENRLVFPIDDPRLPQWPFNREYVVARDPDILKFPSHLLPWEVDKRSKKA